MKEQLVNFKTVMLLSTQQKTAIYLFLQGQPITPRGKCVPTCDSLGLPPGISHNGHNGTLCCPKGYSFAPFWSENEYRFCPFWSGIGYSSRGNYVTLVHECVRRFNSKQKRIKGMNKKESVICEFEWILRNLFVGVLISAIFA